MRALIATLLALMVAVPAAAKTYSADRFDTRVRILDDGSLEVVETVVFRFEGGTFEHVFRDLSRRRTETSRSSALRWTARLSLATRSGQVEVSTARRFASLAIRPRADSTHTFDLSYLVRGSCSGKPDMMSWSGSRSRTTTTTASPRARSCSSCLPRHSYGLRSTRSGWLKSCSNRAASGCRSRARHRQERVAQDASRVRRGRDHRCRAGVAAAAIDARAVAPRWIRQPARPRSRTDVHVWAPPGYDSPPSDRFDGSSRYAAGHLRPGVAGALVANGSISLQHAMATLFALADRGVVTITEEPRKWGQRHFTLQRRQANQALAPEETAVLDLAFHHKGHPVDDVSLTQARNRIASRLPDFKAAVNQELRTLGLLDDERMRVRARYLGFAIAFLILASCSSPRPLSWLASSRRGRFSSSAPSPRSPSSASSSTAR